MAKVKFYGYAKCGTCRNAKKWMVENKVDFQEIPIREKPPAKKELQEALTQYDSDLRILFNTSGMDYRQGNWKQKLTDISKKEAIQELSQNGNLIKRPFVVTPDGYLIGFKEEEWKARLR